MEAEVVPLADLLDVDLGGRWLARHSYDALRAACRARGHHLAARAWTARSVAASLPFPVEGLEDAPLSAPGPGPVFTRFLALVARKPAA